MLPTLEAIDEVVSDIILIWSNYSDLTPNGGLVREIPLFQGNLGW